DQKKRALSGINITLQGEAKSLSMSTDSEGNYAFDQLPAGGSYTITPQPSQKITFTPPGRSINNLRKDASADFSGVVQVDEVYKISGRVTSNGKPLGGVHIRIGGARATSTETDANGYYAFGGLRAGGDYTIMPVDEKANFTPSSRSINNLRKDDSADFSGVVQIEEFYKISGRVTNNGKPLGGVTIRLGGAKTASIETDTNGYYSFGDLRAGHSFTIMPAGGNTNFTPPSRSINNLRNDVSADFSGLLQVDELYKISGRVTNNGKPIAGVNMTIAGAKTSSVTTDGNGHYTFSELRAGGSYIITPASGQTDFAPRSRSIKNLRKDGSADFSSVVPCTDDDRAREREALLTRYAATWHSSIESEKPRVIAATVAENLPAGVEPRAVESTATLGPVRYDVTFLGCSPFLVTARYEWQVRMYFNGKTKVVAVPRHKTCGRVVGMGLCR
ncbi:MAG TPA: carboxypeptidase regulatory-like domain-containing protein, partial [Pyrinomonadaceae bacterium]|nr:carboxypeptidase regulatory-like domain-containing protein [Pyrinomonadaceae bacterium]